MYNAQPSVGPTRRLQVLRSCAHWLSPKRVHCWRAGWAYATSWLRAGRVVVRPQEPDFQGAAEDRNGGRSNMRGSACGASQTACRGVAFQGTARRCRRRQALTVRALRRDSPRLVLSVIAGCLALFSGSAELTIGAARFGDSDDVLTPITSAAYLQAVLNDKPIARWQRQASNDIANADGARDPAAGRASINVDLTTTSSVGLEFWLNWYSYKNDDRLAMEFSPDYNESNGGFIVDPDAPGGVFQVGMLGPAGYTATSFTRPSAGVFHYYVINLTKASTGDEITVHVDGIPVATRTNAAANTGNFANSTLYLMSRSGSSLFGDGALDYVAVYTAPLSETAVGRHYAASRGTPPPTVSGSQTLKPTALPLSAPELANPGRGQYREFNGTAPDPSDWPAPDAYERFRWSDLEPHRPTQPQDPNDEAYNWSAVDTGLAAAASRGGRYWFRVYAQGDGTWNEIATPGWVPNTTDYIPQFGYSVQHPLWNDPATVQAIVDFVQAASIRYNDDPRFLWAEIGWIGESGEWSGQAFNPDDLKNQPMTLQNGERIVDAYVQYWTHKRIIAESDWTETEYNQRPGLLDYALAQSPISGPIGWRVDGLGAPGVGGNVSASTNGLVKQRWQKAPVITEYATGQGQQAFVNALRQIPEYHVSQSGSWSYGYPPQTTMDANGLEAWKLMGYRYVLDSLTLPAVISVEDDFEVATTWENVNVAPTYLPWVVRFQLRDSSSVVWQAELHLDLSKLLPTFGNPNVQRDVLNLSGRVAPGVYAVALQITDPDGISPPMKLAIDGRGVDGSYTLGGVVVN
jgi:Concanavalin A-like lectin/glucanases superfamily/Domain of unknown function (DUF4832)